eukprot:TRINITY_DN5903_c0_g1_i1.p1 TRINITY_DN5903_c0_g1~~TRINITY_DN5903_c0_g1_i1.p1  ORF type:complete len:298 (-),score=50.41 TRINITY_DN5903_c0_g1_i1:820-1713(-)
MTERIRLYHEKQQAGLCAVHALNSLLQGAYYTAVDLMHIAQELDKKEKVAMAELGTETSDFLKFVAQDSGNVADDGNYSIQVVQEALKVWGARAVPILSEAAGTAKSNPLGEKAFICNLASHWLTIRKFNGHWFNFNSLLDKPQYLSTFYLSAFMDTLQMKGYSIFVIHGDLPKRTKINLNDSGNWVTVPCKPTPQTKEEAARTSGRPQTSFETQLQKALAESMNTATPGQVDHMKRTDGGDEDPELIAAIAASLSPANGSTQTTSEKETNNTDTNTNPPGEEDDDLQKAILMSMGS